MLWVTIFGLKRVPSISISNGCADNVKRVQNFKLKDLLTFIVIAWALKSIKKLLSGKQNKPKSKCILRHWVTCLSSPLGNQSTLRAFWFTLKIELIFLPNVRVALMICKLEVSRYLEFSAVNMRRECINSLVDVNIFFHREYFGFGVCVRSFETKRNTPQTTNAFFFWSEFNKTAPQQIGQKTSR